MVIPEVQGAKTEEHYERPELLSSILLVCLIFLIKQVLAFVPSVVSSYRRISL